MARNVIPNDGRSETNELDSSLVVPAGASYTEQTSSINAESGGSGLRIDDADELIVRATVVGTMPAGTEMVVTPIVPGFGDLPDITVTLATVTDGTVKGTLKDNDNLRDASLLKITYRFIQGGAQYTVSAVNLQVRRAGAVGNIWSILTSVWNAVSKALRTKEVDPLSQHYKNTTPDDVTNGTDGTYYRYVSMDGFKKTGTILELNGGSGTVTVTLEGTMQDEGLAPASRSFKDITSLIFGVASFTADDVLLDDVEALAVFTYLRFKIVAATGGANDADWAIYNTRLY